MNLMTPVSNYLNSFIKEEFKSNFEILDNLQLSNVSIHFIQQFIQFIENAYNAFKHTPFLEENIHYNDSIPFGKDSNVIPTIIKENIIKSRKIGKIYKFEINKQQIILTIVYPFSTDENYRKISKKKSNLFFKKCCQRIFLWLYVANKFKQMNCSNTIHIYIYMTDFFKLLPTNPTTFDIINVNTAFTTSCQENTEIHIFRQEEWFKVLIHETFHCFGLDFSNDINITNQLEKQIGDLFNLKSINIKTYETYCELNATLINIIFCYFFYMKTQKRKPNQFNIAIFKQLLLQEQIFSVFQCDKVLSHIGFKYNDFLSSQKQTIRSEDEEYNIFVYYILKSIGFVYINNYIEWLVNYNNNSLLFDIPNEINNQMFYKFIQSSVKNNIYNHIINNIHEWKIQNHLIIGEDSLIQNTLRMTLWELQ
jgi:hypothetical protein